MDDDAPVTVPQMLALLELEKLGDRVFQGHSPNTRVQRTFGGQVAAQALVAAGLTAEAGGPTPARRVHSLHSYFVRMGNPNIPITYTVEPIRDGRGFSTRRVTASQGDRTIFLMSAQFQVPEPGLDHQDPMPPTTDPEGVLDVRDPSGDAFGANLRNRPEWDLVDLRIPPAAYGEYPATAADAPALMAPPPHRQMWFRVNQALPPNPLLHVCLLTYVSDLALLGAVFLHHPDTPRERIQAASLDHALWFHRDARADDWILYDLASPSASGGRGLATGRMFDRRGVLVASVVQEGLVRLTPEASA